MNYYAVVRIDAHHQKFRADKVLRDLPADTQVAVSIQRGCPEIGFVDGANKPAVDFPPTEKVKAAELDNVYLQERAFTPCGGSTSIDLRIEWTSAPLADGAAQPAGGAARDAAPVATNNNTTVENLRKGDAVLVTDGRFKKDVHIDVSPLRIVSDAENDVVLFERLLEGCFPVGYDGKVTAYPQAAARGRMFFEREEPPNLVEVPARRLFDVVSEDSRALTAMLENEVAEIKKYAEQLHRASEAPWSLRTLPMFRTVEGQKAYQEFVVNTARTRSLQTVLLANPQYASPAVSEAELVTREAYRMSGTRVSLDMLRNVVLARGGDSRNAVHERLLGHRPGQGDLVAKEVAHQLSLPEFRRDGLGLALYVNESLAAHFDATKHLITGNPPCDLASRTVPRVMDGCCQGRAAMVIAGAALYDVDMVPHAHALVKCAPLPPPPPPAPRFMSYSRETRMAALADAALERIQLHLDAMERSSGNFRGWMRVAFGRAALLAVNELLVAGMRAPNCSGKNYESGTRYEDSVGQLDKRFGTVVLETARELDTRGYDTTPALRAAAFVDGAFKHAEMTIHPFPPGAPPVISEIFYVYATLESMEKCDESHADSAYLRASLARALESPWIRAGAWFGYEGPLHRTQEQITALDPIETRKRVESARVAAEGILRTVHGAQDKGQVVNMANQARIAATQMYEAAYDDCIAAYHAGTATDNQRAFVQRLQKLSEVDNKMEEPELLNAIATILGATVKKNGEDNAPSQ